MLKSSDLDFCAAFYLSSILNNKVNKILFISKLYFSLPETAYFDVSKGKIINQ